VRPDQKSPGLFFLAKINCRQNGLFSDSPGESKNSRVILKITGDKAAKAIRFGNAIIAFNVSDNSHQ
jgi:hypothetical protein